jgi:hypothetical protein
LINQKYIDDICINFRLNAFYNGKIRINNEIGDSYNFQDKFGRTLEIIFIEKEKGLLVVSKIFNPFYDERYKNYK